MHTYIITVIVDDQCAYVRIHVYIFSSVTSQFSKSSQTAFLCFKSNIWIIYNMCNYMGRTLTCIQYDLNYICLCIMWWKYSHWFCKFLTPYIYLTWRICDWNLFCMQLPNTLKKFDCCDWYLRNKLNIHINCVTFE